MMVAVGCAQGAGNPSSGSKDLSTSAARSDERATTAEQTTSHEEVYATLQCTSGRPRCVLRRHSSCAHPRWCGRSNPACKPRNPPDSSAGSSGSCCCAGSASGYARVSRPPTRRSLGAQSPAHRDGDPFFLGASLAGNAGAHRRQRRLAFPRRYQMGAVAVSLAYVGEVLEDAPYGAPRPIALTGRSGNAAFDEPSCEAA
jgi:hypothetical protein